MKNAILFLRIAYWWGIIVDALMAFLMLFPQLFVRFMSVALPLDAGLRFGLQLGAPLMIGWAVLLFWADRKPLERRDILLLTLLVVAGYVVIEVNDIVFGMASLHHGLPLLTMQALIIAMYIFSYSNAIRVIRDAKNKTGAL